MCNSVAYIITTKYFWVPGKKKRKKTNKCVWLLSIYCGFLFYSANVICSFVGCLYFFHSSPCSTYKSCVKFSIWPGPPLCPSCLVTVCCWACRVGPSVVGLCSSLLGSHFFHIHVLLPSAVTLFEVQLHLVTGEKRGDACLGQLCPGGLVPVPRPGHHCPGAEEPQPAGEVIPIWTVSFLLAARDLWDVIVRHL